MVSQFLKYQKCNQIISQFTETVIFCFRIMFDNQSSVLQPCCLFCYMLRSQVDLLITLITVLFQSLHSPQSCFQYLLGLLISLITVLFPQILKVVFNIISRSKAAGFWFQKRKTNATENPSLLLKKRYQMCQQCHNNQLP